MPEEQTLEQRIADLERIVGILAAQLAQLDTASLQAKIDNLTAKATELEQIFADIGVSDLSLHINALIEQGVRWGKRFAVNEQALDQHKKDIKEIRASADPPEA